MNHYESIDRARPVSRSESLVPEDCYVVLDFEATCDACDKMQMNPQEKEKFSAMFGSPKVSSSLEHQGIQKKRDRYLIHLIRGSVISMTLEKTQKVVEIL